MASMASAKKGDIVTLPGGKKIVSDGKGGGKVQRPTKKRVVPDSKPTKNKPKAKTRPAARSTPTGRGLRGLANRGDKIADLVKKTRGN